MATPLLPALPALLPVLYSFRRCPYAIRARMALHCAGIQVTLNEVALRQKPATLLAISPKGTVPVLVTPQGQIIDQSLDIMRWALLQNDPHGWLAGTHSANRIQHWIRLNDEVFKPLLDRYKYPNRHLIDAGDQTHARQQALTALIHPMAAQLQQSPWLLGASVSLADVALFPFVRQFAGVDATWFNAQAWPALHHWLNGWQTSPLFEAVMAKR